MFKLKKERTLRSTSTKYANFYMPLKNFSANKCVCQKQNKKVLIIDIY